MNSLLTLGSNGPVVGAVVVGDSIVGVLVASLFGVSELVELQAKIRTIKAKEIIMRIKNFY